MFENNIYERYSVVNSIINCKIDGDNIFQCDYGGKPQSQIGKTVESYKQLKEICEKQNKKLEEYYNRLVEAGLEQLKKTPEEIAQENNELISKLLSTVNELKNEVNSMKEEKDNVRYDKTNANGSKNDGSKRQSTIKPKSGC